MSLATRPGSPHLRAALAPLWGRSLRPLLAILFCGPALLSAAHADGGHVSLHASSGAYTVTLLTTPVPLASGSADLTLLVQPAEAAGGGDAAEASMPEATASGLLQLAAGAPIPVSFGRTSAGSPLLSAGVTLPAAGDYALTLTVSAPGQRSAVFHAMLPVAANHGRRTKVILALLLPLAAVLLFLLNQHIKAQVYSRYAKS